jgi:hypothetical protein
VPKAVQASARMAALNIASFVFITEYLHCDCAQGNCYLSKSVHVKVCYFATKMPENS